MPPYECVFIHQYQFVFNAPQINTIYIIRHRLAFAAVNLGTACSALSYHPATGIIVLLSMFLGAGWIIIWFLALMGLDEMIRSNGGSFFLMIISLYWGSTVASNVRQ